MYVYFIFLPCSSTPHRQWLHALLVEGKKFFKNMMRAEKNNNSLLCNIPIKYRLHCKITGASGVVPLLVNVQQHTLRKSDNEGYIREHNV